MEIKATLAETLSHKTWDMLFHPPDLHDDPSFVQWDHARPWFNFCDGPWAGTANGWRPCKPREWYPHLDVLYVNDNPNGTLNYGEKSPNYPYYVEGGGSVVYIRDNNTWVVKKELTFPVSIFTSFAFAVGGNSHTDGGGAPFDAKVREVVSSLLDLGLISDAEPESLASGRSLTFAVGERLQGLSTRVTVLHDNGSPIPVILDTHSDPGTFPRARLLVVLHDFVPFPYEDFVDEIKAKFGEDSEDHIVVF